MMIIYIAIYSLFDTVDFNDEVVVLYGEVTFWATVIMSFALCLGMFIYLLRTSDRISTLR